MAQSKLSIFFLCLMPIYVVPVLSMHICIGQEHHHGNCEGDMDGDSDKEKKEKEDFPYQLDKAEHLHCFELQKENNPSIYPKYDIPVQQITLIAAVFNLKPETGRENTNPSYRPPPNKEPPASAHKVRPPPFFFS